MVKLKEWMRILVLHRQGLPVAAIAERTGHDHNTVRKSIREGLATPKYMSRHLDRRWLNLMNPACVRV